MKNYVCMLSFPRDKNLKGKVYWYRSEYCVAKGDEVVVQIGPHRKLQVGKVVSVYEAKENGKIVPSLPYSVLAVSSGKEEESPYPIDKMKSLVCPFGYRKVPVDKAKNVRDLGGLFYDEKHVTAYGNFLRGDLPSSATAPLGIDELFYFGSDDPPLKGSYHHFSSLFSREVKSAAVPKDGLIAFSIEEEYDESPLSIKDFKEAFDKRNEMKDVFTSIALAKGRVLFTSKNGMGETDLISTVLLLLVGVSPRDIAKDYSLSFCESKQNVKFEKGDERDLSEKEYLKVIKNFLKTYDSAEAYLRWIGLEDEKIEGLRSRMTRVEFQ